jgi:hypothetical protein
MEKQILVGVDPSERLQQLIDVADKVEKFNYPRELSQGELEELKNELAQNHITIDNQDQVLKSQKEAYNASVKPLRELNKDILRKVKTGVEDVIENVYLLKDLEEEKMGYYSKDGKLVFERSLKPEEKQYTISDFTNKKIS